MIKAIIIDDEQRCVDSLYNDLSKYCAQVHVLAKCNSGKEGLKAIMQYKPELVFLDIEMPWMNGFEMLELIDHIDFEVIFTTAYDQFAVKAFRISAADYLLKPIDKDELIEAIQRVLQRNKNHFSKDHLEIILQNMQPSILSKRIALPTKDGYDFVLVQDIMYCEADGNYTWIYLTNEKKKLVTRSLKDLDKLLSEYNFCRIHHSSLVNLDHAQKYVRGDGGYVVMTNGTSLNVSRAKKEELMKKIYG